MTDDLGHALEDIAADPLIAREAAVFLFIRLLGTVPSKDWVKFNQDFFCDCVAKICEG